MLQDIITDNLVNNVLKQEGAVSIETKPAYINIATFELSDDVKVVYSYEMRENDAIYLQRLIPYPMQLGELSNEDEVIDIVKNDIERFKDAITSSNFNKFITISKRFSDANKEMEKLLLSPKTVETKDVEKIESDLNNIENDLTEMANNAR